MTVEKQKEFIRFLIRQLRDTHHELAAYRVMAFIAGDAGFPVAELLERARISPDVQTRVDRQLAGLEELIENTDEEIHDQTLRDYLENWKPEGKPN